MKTIGIIGTGLMGSSLATCLARKGYDLILYNRTHEKAQMLAEKLGARVAASPAEVLAEAKYTVMFVSTDEAVLNIVSRIPKNYPGSADSTIINASTITPQASVKACEILRSHGVKYVEAPVFGSTTEARDCRLISIVAGERDLVNSVVGFINEYSLKTFYAGEIPRALVLKLAINNVALSLPAILAESFALLEAWGINRDVFLNIVSNLWFNDAVKRYLPRIFEERSPRFKVWMAGKDYSYVAKALMEKKLPALISTTLSSAYMLAAANGYLNKDYPQVARYFIELAKKATNSAQQ